MVRAGCSDPIMLDRLSKIGDPVTVFTFGRSGTHMVIDLIRHQFTAFAAWKYPGAPNDSVFTWLDQLAIGAKPLDRQIARLGRAKRPILTTHWLAECRSWLAQNQPTLAHWLLDRGRVLYIVRDPTHAISSAWPLERLRACRGYQPIEITGAHIARLTKRWAETVRIAQCEDGCLILRYEDVRGDPALTIQKLGAWLGETPLWREPLMLLPHRSRMGSRIARLTTVRPRSTAMLMPRIAKSKFQLEWTRELIEVVRSNANEELASLRYELSDPLRL